MANIAFVQSAVGSGSGVTMSSAPAQRHALVAIGFQQGMGSWTAGTGWTQIAAATGTNTNTGPGGTAFYKIAGPSESTTQTPTTTSSACVVIFEFSAVSGFPSGNADFQRSFDRTAGNFEHHLAAVYGVVMCHEPPRRAGAGRWGP